MIKQELIYSTSKLEKILLKDEIITIPERGFKTLYERTFELDDDKITVSYIEGGANCGCRYTFVIIQSIYQELAGYVTYGWSKGWKLPVPERGELKDFRQKIIIANAMKGISKMALPYINEIPDFRDEGRFARHKKDGWLTNSIFALPRDSWMEGKVWSIREGIYISFPDGSYRLIPHRVWGKWNMMLKDLFATFINRQGDLYVFTSDYLMLSSGEVYDMFAPANENKYIRLPWELQKDNSISIDNHTIIFRGRGLSCQLRDGSYAIKRADDDCVLEFIHPEHEKVEIELSSQIYLITLLPGTSHPFQRKVD